MHIDRKILACVDATAVAQSVTDYAAWAARRLGAPMELLHVLDRHVELSARQDRSGAIGLGAEEKLLDRLVQEDEERTRAAREEGRLFLHRLRERALDAGVASVDTRLRHGDVEETIAEQQEGSRLLVLGRAGAKSNPPEPGLGKHLEWVVRSVSRPVLVATQAYRQPSRVLFAFDGSGVTRKGVEMLAGSSLLKGLPVHMLMAGSPNSADKRQLDLAVQTLNEAGMDTASTIAPGSLQEAIPDAMTRHGCDLLVMGAYSHSPLRSLFFGSKTTGLLKTAGAPILLLR